MRDAWRHVGALTLLGIATLAWMWPILARLTEVVPGAGPGDNLTFVWNLWWMREALARSDYAFFRSPLIFHPFGVDLTLHTHTALTAFVAALVAPAAPLLVVQNITIVAHLFLNGAAAYWLAYHITRHARASLLGAAVFGWSPYIGAHLQGHFNLIAVWPLPLAALLTLKSLAGHRSARWLLGLVLAATLYIDYYMALYAVLLTAIIVLDDCAVVRLNRDVRRSSWQKRLMWTMAALLAIDMLVVAIIAATGGGVFSVAGHRVSMTSVNNPLSAAGILLTLVFLLGLAPMISLRFDASRLRRSAAPTGIAIGLLLLAVAPLMFRIVRLSMAGDYVTQRYLWRSAPRGVDVATLLLGHPYGLLTGTASRHVYETLGIDPIEQSAWLGPAVIALAIMAFAQRRTSASLRPWLPISLVAGIWALGPYLMLFGRNTSLILPATVIRYVPLLSNARIPGRAIVLVYMAAAMLTAIGFTAYMRSGSGVRRYTAIAIAAFAMLDYAPMPPPAFAPGDVQIIDTLRSEPAGGAVLNLPLGIRDGFGESGRFDSMTLYAQTLHGHPILGGFVARLPRSIGARYRELPLVSTVLRSSAGEAISNEERDVDRREGRAVARELDVRYVIVDRARASFDLVQHVRTVLPLRLLATDDARDLYVVESPSH